MKKQIIAVLALACVGLSACGNTAESAEPKITSAAETTTTTTAETTAKTTTTEPTTTTAETTTTQATTTETPEPKSDMMTVEECLQKIVKEKYEDEINYYEEIATMCDLAKIGGSDMRSGERYLSTTSIVGKLDLKNKDDIVKNRIEKDSVIATEGAIKIFSKNTADTDYIQASGLSLYKNMITDKPVDLKCFAKYDFNVSFSDETYNLGGIGYNPLIFNETKEYSIEEAINLILNEIYQEEIEIGQIQIADHDDFSQEIEVLNIRYYIPSCQRIGDVTVYGVLDQYRNDEKINIDYLFCNDSTGFGSCIYAPNAEYFYQ